MSLSWTSPRDDGGCRLDGYIVECREESGKWTRPEADAVSGTEYVVRGLKADASYEFRVAAKNKAGVGEFSGSSKSTKAGEQMDGTKPQILDKFKDLTILSPKEAVFECRVELGEPQAKVAASATTRRSTAVRST